MSMRKAFVKTVVVLMIAGYALGAPDCSKNIEPEMVLDRCCDQPKWDNDESIESKCRTSSISCVAECMLNETNVLVDGKVDMGRVRTSVENDLKSNPEFAPIVIKAFETCATKLQRMNTEMTPPSDGCNPYSMLLMACVNTHSLANCPPSKWKSTTECNEVKDYVNLCL